MKVLRVSATFKKDLKRARRQRLPIAKLEAVVDALRAGNSLAPASRAHPLKGIWKNYWDCHIQPDWLLIYKVTDDELLLARIGTHAELFGR